MELLDPQPIYEEAEFGIVVDHDQTFTFEVLHDPSITPMIKDLQDLNAEEFTIHLWELNQSDPGSTVGPISEE